MKKIFLLLAASLICLTTISAQVSQEDADQIVIERLSNETSDFIIYAKDGVQTAFEVITASGETLELSYPCWVYYVNFTDEANGKYLIVKESNGNLLEIKAKNDDGLEGVESWRVVSILICGVENPITDLPWLKARIDEYILLIQEGVPLSDVAIYQCTYGNGETGFLDFNGNVNPFHNCEGEILCELGGYLGETCSHLNIDLDNVKIIWDASNVPPPPCVFENPLEDIKWLKDFIEDYPTPYAQHCRIYQCTYNDVGTGFIVDYVTFGYWILRGCIGTGLCSSTNGDCDRYNIDYDSWELIWEYLP